jgi:hypothetical protein
MVQLLKINVVLAYIYKLIQTTITVQFLQEVKAII